MELLNNKFFLESKKSFFLEALVALVIDVSVVICVWIICFIAFDNKKLFIHFMVTVTLVYFLLTFLFHYKTAIFLMMDIKKRNIIKETVQITDYKVETSISDRLGHNYIKKFYSNELLVDRFKLLYKDITTGKKGYVRLPMSRKKRAVLYEFLSDYSFNIYFYRDSKVLIYCELEDESNVNLYEKIKELNQYV